VRGVKLWACAPAFMGTTKIIRAILVLHRSCLPKSVHDAGARQSLAHAVLTAKLGDSLAAAAKPGGSQSCVGRRD